MPVTVVVLAAGQGKRMHSELPKVLQPLAGRPLLGHVLDAARALQPAAIHVVYGHGGDRVRAAFADQDLRWTLQSEQLGTGHAVEQALPSIPDDHQVLVLYGDVPLVRSKTLQRLVADSADGKLALLTTLLDDPTGYGRVLRNELGEVVRVVEDKDASLEERRVNEVNTGLMALTAGPLRRYLAQLTNDNAQGEYYLTDVIELAAKQKYKIEGIVVDEPTEVFGINDRAQLAFAERTLQRQYARELMVSGVTLADPERLDIRGKLSAGRDVFIDVGAVFEGEVQLGDRVHVGPHAVIVDTVLGEDCVVHPQSVLHGVIAGAGCEIGPFARLRPGTQLAAHVKVGNFVEVKKSQVAEGSKMNHLSYIGDTSVGRGVNIGAGTITCNYDGANKHRTVIGDEVFIGSGTMLVAPVEIGDGATVGAGSTITKNAPAGQLTVARSRQTSIDGWKRPRKKTTAGAEKAAQAKPRKPSPAKPKK
ncbi:MAG TPA: bifunctional UDP-N-acetylglucosamine diphosphorylase/glucosamine-1-phosphate N-acetyltransferase GlmU [Gammaproteobacteria bacterium]|nr:bifunctional UDP-N-acetylglucosamine diphosphorylase/glucosamine-1-phosphate N-acetyltransferase GlmU [Gammaproteobacteria bacterium]